jgi:hypothetical protein
MRMGLTDITKAQEAIIRYVSTDITKAFMNRKSKSSSNTKTDGTTYYLHGNAIAWHCDDGFVALTLADYPTTTTRDRLNTICMMMFDCKPFHQKKGVQYYNDQKIDSDTVIRIKRLELLDEVTPCTT